MIFQLRFSSSQQTCFYCGWTKIRSVLGKLGEESRPNHLLAFGDDLFQRLLFVPELNVDYLRHWLQDLSDNIYNANIVEPSGIDETYSRFLQRLCSVDCICELLPQSQPMTDFLHAL